VRQLRCLTDDDYEKRVKRCNQSVGRWWGHLVVTLARHARVDANDDLGLTHEKLRERVAELAVGPNRSGAQPAPRESSLNSAWAAGRASVTTRP
jgi:hypothetical protein